MPAEEGHRETRWGARGEGGGASELTHYLNPSYQDAGSLDPHPFALGRRDANKGDKVAAAQHLRLALKSSDPNLRDLAQRLLKELESK